MGPEPPPVHWLSKEARFRVIDLLLSSRSVKQLAKELGVSPTAIRKYISRETHPSDETMARALEIAAPYEREKLIRIVVEDLAVAIERLYNSIDDQKVREMARERILGAIGERKEANAGHGENS